MDRTPPRDGPPDNRQRVVALGVLWAVAILATVDIEEVVGNRLRALSVEDAMRALPLAAAIVITGLTVPGVRRGWPRNRRIIGVIVFGGLSGLAVAVGPREVLLVVGLAAIGGLLAAWVLALPRRVAPVLSPETLEGLGPRDRLELTDARLKLQNEVRTTALQAIAGLAVLAGALLAFRQLTEDRQQFTATRELTLQGQASERFTRAIDQLGSERLEVQLGGIYGLEQIARQAPDNRLPVTEVLVAYLHRRIPRRANPSMPPPERLGIRAPDVQAAVTVLVRRGPAPTAGLTTPIALPDPPINLSGLDLRGADISGQPVRMGPHGTRLEVRPGQLESADLRGSDLRGATFAMVDLGFADFGGADLRGVDFSNADFFAPGIAGAKFRGALADASTKWPDERPVGVKMM